MVRGARACEPLAVSTHFRSPLDSQQSSRVSCGCADDDKHFELDWFFSVPGGGRMKLGTGFFTHSVEEQRFLFEHVLAAPSSWLSPKSVPLPLKVDDVYVKKRDSRKLRLGYFLEDGFLAPVPGCARVVRETVERLRADGHEMVSRRHV